MKLPRFLAPIALLAALSTTTGCHLFNGDDDSTTTRPSTTTQPVSMSGPINDNCPVSGEPVDESVEMASYNGHSIGFCCNSCPGDWEDWGSQKKAEFVSQAMN